MVGEITGKQITVKHLTLPKDDPMQRKPHIERAQRLLGWSPMIPLKDGLTRTVEYFKNTIK
jgi:UDP-glucuronate decarboxylase